MLETRTLIAGRYDIRQPLGRGGNGLVYAAIDQVTEKRVAVKVLGPLVLHDRTASEKFKLEATVAGRVESEHIVQVSDAGVDPMTGVAFLVMELLKGRDLQQLVEQGGPVPAAATVEYLKQVASGLDKAHAWIDHNGRPAPIVHRDLKPDNLFLTHREDGTPLVKILDFGIAKVLSGSATLSGDIRGTPQYMAPEQLSTAPVTPATDIWAFGLVAFFLLTGHSYWRSVEQAQVVWPVIMKEVCEGPIVSPRARVQELGVDVALPAAFDDWFRRCVHLEPAKRFQRAEDAVRSLLSALEVAMPESRPPGLPAAGVNDGRNRRRPWLWLALGSLFAASTLFAFVPTDAPSPPRYPDRPIPPSASVSIAVPLPSSAEAPPNSKLDTTQPLHASSASAVATARPPPSVQRGSGENALQADPFAKPWKSSKSRRARTDLGALSD